MIFPHHTCLVIGSWTLSIVFTVEVFGFLYDDITWLSPLKDGDFAVGDNWHESYSEDLKKVVIVVIEWSCLSVETQAKDSKPDRKASNGFDSWIALTDL